MTYTEPTYDECVELLTKCIDERGEDFVYENPLSRSNDYTGPACLYVHNDGPGCIVGLMLNKHGVPLKAFVNDYDGHYDMTGSVDNIWYPLFGTYLDGKKRALLQRVQHYQDSRETWGTAFNMAMEKAEAYESV